MKEKLNARWPQPYQRVAVGAALLAVLYLIGLIFWVTGGYTLEGESASYGDVFELAGDSFLYVLPIILMICGIVASLALFVLRGQNAKYAVLANLGIAVVTFLLCTITVLVIKGKLNQLSSWFDDVSFHVNFCGIMHFIFMLLILVCTFYVYTQSKIGGVDHNLTAEDMLKGITGKSAPVGGFGAYGAPGAYGVPGAAPTGAPRPKFCSGCGAPLTPGTSFCGACGKKN